MGFAKPEEFQIESNLSGPERAQNGHTGVEFNPLGWRELAGLKSPTRPDKPRHEVAAAVVFSESVLFERPDSTTIHQQGSNSSLSLPPFLAGGNTKRLTCLNA
jgi:hypothetical protein